MKTFSLILVVIFIFSLSAFAQDTSFAVTSNGNVGIGTTDPANLLDVNGITNIRGTLYLGNTANSNITADDLTLYLRSSAGVVLQNAIGASTHSYFSNNGNSFINALGGNVGIGTTSPQAKLDVRGDIAVTGTVDGVDISNFKSEFDQRLSDYTKYSSLNYGSVTVTTTWTKLNTTSGTHQFVKTHSNSKIEVYVNSRFRGGSFSTATGIRFQVRINDTILPDFDNNGSINQSSTDEFLTMYAVFENLNSGTFTVSIWGKTNVGSSSGVSVDPGGWGGSIIVKETW